MKMSNFRWVICGYSGKPAGYMLLFSYCAVAYLIGSLSQKLLNDGEAKTGIIACDTFDYEVIDKIYTAFDSLTLNVLLNPDGTVSKEVLAGVAKGIKANFADAAAKGELPNDLKWLGGLVSDISFNNANSYFGFNA